jgi:hypothetical protein
LGCWTQIAQLKGMMPSCQVGANPAVFNSQKSFNAILPLAFLVKLFGSGTLLGSGALRN